MSAPQRSAAGRFCGAGEPRPVSFRVRGGADRRQDTGAVPLHFAPPARDPRAGGAFFAGKFGARLEIAVRI